MLSSPNCRLSFTNVLNFVCSYTNLNNVVINRGKMLQTAVHSLQLFDRSMDQVRVIIISIHHPSYPFKKNSSNRIIYSDRLQFLAWLSEAESLSENAEQEIERNPLAYKVRNRNCNSHLDIHPISIRKRNNSPGAKASLHSNVSEIKYTFRAMNPIAISTSAIYPTICMFYSWLRLDFSMSWKTVCLMHMTWSTTQLRLRPQTIQHFCCWFRLFFIRPRIELKTNADTFTLQSQPQYYISGILPLCSSPLSTIQLKTMS